MEIKKIDQEYSKVYFKLLNFLSFKQRSEKEVLDKIRFFVSKTSLSPKEKIDIKDKVIKSLKIDGYLKDSNDEDFTTSYIEGLQKSGRTFNKMRISKFLNKKGILREIINGALENLEDDSVYESVLNEASKKIRTLKDESSFLKKKKLINYLYRKGYPFDIVSTVVDTLPELQ